MKTFSMHTEKLYNVLRQNYKYRLVSLISQMTTPYVCHIDELIHHFDKHTLG
jgi:hypothetical protein